MTATQAGSGSQDSVPHPVGRSNTGVPVGRRCEFCEKLRQLRLRRQLRREDVDRKGSASDALWHPVTSVDPSSPIAVERAADREVTIDATLGSSALYQQLITEGLLPHGICTCPVC